MAFVEDETCGKKKKDRKSGREGTVWTGGGGWVDRVAGRVHPRVLQVREDEVEPNTRTDGEKITWVGLGGKMKVG